MPGKDSLKKKEYARRYREKNKEKIKEWYQNNAEKRRAYQKEYGKNHYLLVKGTQEQKYKEYKGNATCREIEFNLTLRAFSKYWQLPCYYCGDSIETIGLDRINSKIGYEEHNIRPCCSVCNKMKINYTKEFFINHCNKVASWTFESRSNDGKGEE